MIRKSSMNGSQFLPISKEKTKGNIMITIFRYANSEKLVKNLLVQYDKHIMLMYQQHKM